MNFYRRGNVWWIRFSKDGKEIRKSLRSKNKADAKEFAEKMKVVVKANDREAALKLVDILFPPAGKPGVSLCDAWAQYAETARACGRLNASQRTIDVRRQNLNRFIAFVSEYAPGISRAHEITGPVAAAFASSIADRSVKTRQNIIADLSTVWSMLGKVDEQINNPFAGLVPRAAAGEVRRMEAFSRDQEAAVFAAADKIGKGWPLACLIARNTGLRYGDVANLTWGDIDLEKDIIAITPSKTARHGVTVMLPIVGQLHDALAASVGNHAANEYVLPGHASAHADRSGAAYNALNFREVLDEAGIGEGYTFHSWRHTFRSRLAEAGVDLETAKRLCGHTTDETSRHYDHASHIDEYRAAVTAAAERQ